MLKICFDSVICKVICVQRKKNNSMESVQT